MRADERVKIRLAVHAAIMDEEVRVFGISRELASKRAYNEVLRMKWRELEKKYESLRFKEEVEKRTQKAAMVDETHPVVKGAPYDMSERQADEFRRDRRPSRGKI